MFCDPISIFFYKLLSLLLQQPALLFVRVWYTIEKSETEASTMGLKDNWKEAGTGLGHAFRDLGKTLVKTVKTGVDKADDWANRSEAQKKDEETKEEA